jgi:3'-5' exoribonuclease
MKAVAKKKVPKKAMKNGSKHVLIKHVKRGDSFSGIYFLDKLFHRIAKTGSTYADLVLGDKSGTQFVRFWGKVENASPGDFVSISANVEEYMGQPQIVAQSVKRVESPANMTDYIAKIPNRKELLERFNELLAEVHRICDETGDQMCRRLLDSMFSDDHIMEKFKDAPFSTWPHYGMRGGLLEHSVRTTEIAVEIAKRMRIKEPNIAVLITAGLLHKIGAIDCYEFKGCVPLKSSTGILVGPNANTLSYIFSTIQSVIEKEDEEEELSPESAETARRVLHVIASHDVHDDSGVVPLTEEALVFMEAYRTDTTLAEAVDFIDKDENREKFSAYDPFLKRQYYKGNEESQG